MTQNRFIVVSATEDITWTSLYDLQGRDDVRVNAGWFAPIRVPVLGKVLQFVRKVHNSGDVNRIVRLPFKGIWKRTYAVEKGLKEFAKVTEVKGDKENFTVGSTDGMTYIIIYNPTLPYADIEYLNALRATNNVRLVLFCWDKYQSGEGTQMEIAAKIHFDLHFTFERTSAEKHGFLLQQIPNSVLPEEMLQGGSAKYDVAYIGGAGLPERDSLMVALDEVFQKGKVLPYWNVVRDLSVPHSQTSLSSGLGNAKQVSYLEYLRIAKNCDCIIELVRQGQTGPASRYYDAILLNKKLITNNPDHKNLPFYNEKYIRYIESANDITLDLIKWIKDGETVDYGYNGEFSPTVFLERIVKLDAEGVRTRPDW